VSSSRLHNGMSLHVTERRGSTISIEATDHIVCLHPKSRRQWNGSLSQRRSSRA
jgi:hypothetical protein